MIFRDFASLDLPNKNEAEAEKPITHPVIERIFQPTKNRERVEAGIVKYKPVDRQAAKMLMKSPWWAQPPTPEPKFEETTQIKTKDKIMPKAPTLVNAHIAGSAIEVEKSQDELAVELAQKFVKDTHKTLAVSHELVDKAMDARAAMDSLSQDYKAAWFEFQNGNAQRLAELRQSRMAIDSELRQLMANLREVRQFFISADYQVERDRLADFVSLCERLQKLKESGFLDTVAETMLSLAR